MRRGWRVLRRRTDELEQVGGYRMAEIHGAGGRGWEEAPAGGGLSDKWAGPLVLRRQGHGSQGHVT